MKSNSIPQSGFMKCFTERGGKRWRAIDAGELPTVPKCIADLNLSRRQPRRIAFTSGQLLSRTETNRCYSVTANTRCQEPIYCPRTASIDHAKIRQAHTYCPIIPASSCFEYVTVIHEGVLPRGGLI